MLGHARALLRILEGLHGRILWLSTSASLATDMARFMKASRQRHAKALRTKEEVEEEGSPSIDGNDRRTRTSSQHKPLVWRFSGFK